jgi:S1-C subfamily serine protease
MILATQRPRPAPRRRAALAAVLPALVLALLLLAVRAQGAEPPLPAGLTPDELNTIAVFRQASRSVVYIVNRQRIRQPFSNTEVERPVGTGSGFIIGADGTILTNAHVVADASSVTVILADRTELTAQAVGLAPDKDVALIQIKPPPKGLVPLKLGDSSRLVVGQKVLAIGNPFGLEHSLTVGVISALNRESEAPTGRSIRGVIQTDAAINPGNSGGPLLDSHGDVIGMNSAIVSSTGGNVGIGFAIPADMIRKLLPQLRRYGRTVRPLLGILVADDKFADTLGIEGCIVLRVLPGSVADKAGLKGMLRGQDGSVLLGDVIDRLDDYPVGNSDDLLNALEQFSPGDHVTVHTHFRGEARSYSLQLAAPPGVNGR